MSLKKPIIDKSRFESLKKIANSSGKSVQTPEIIKSRFEEETDGVAVTMINIGDLHDAPEQWNFYRPLPEDKFCELIYSIVQNGLLHPIVVWEREDGYMILAGHNRVRAYRALKEVAESTQYDEIPAIIKARNQIDENKAQEIIIDTNWVSRQLTAYEKTNSIIKKYVRIKKDTTAKGKTRDLVGEKLGITGRMVQNYLSLRNLETDFFDMIDDAVITLSDAIKISKLPKDLQEYLVTVAKKDELTNYLIKNLKNADTTEKIDEIIEDEGRKSDEMVTFTVKIPKSRREEFMKVYSDFIKN